MTTKKVERPCELPPSGWNCTRVAGHEGPCAAWPDGDGYVAWLKFRQAQEAIAWSRPNNAADPLSESDWKKRALDAEHLLAMHKKAGEADEAAGNQLREVLSHTGGQPGESVKAEAARIIAELRSHLVAVYEGRLTDRDRMEDVTVRLSHETWRAIQSRWYEAKRSGN